MHRELTPLAHRRRPIAHRRPGHQKGEKEREKLLQGNLYSFYGKSPKPTGPRDGQVVLQLHPAIDLLNIGPVRAGV